LAKQKLTEWLPSKKNIMNLEEKAKKYIDPYSKSISDKEIQDAKSDFTNGYKECVSDLKEFIRVNPNSTTKQITEYLNSL